MLKFSGKFLTNNPLLEKHALKQITKKEIKTKNKPWITTGILTSVRNKIKYTTNFAKHKTKNEKVYYTSCSKTIEMFFQI